MKRERKLSFKEKEGVRGHGGEDPGSGIPDRGAGGGLRLPRLLTRTRRGSLTAEYERLKGELETLYARWEELGALAGE